jgi:hypothetical protein
MGRLGLVDWRSVNARFCALMWILAAVLAIVILTHLHHPVAPAVQHFNAIRTR